MKPTLPLLIGTLPKHQQRQYRKGIRWHIQDGQLAGGRATQLAYKITYDGGVALRQQVLRHLNRLPLGSFRKSHPGNVAQVLSEDVMWLENFTAFYLGSARAETPALLVLITTAAFLYWPAALLASLFWGIGLLPLRTFSRKLARGLCMRSDDFTEAGRHFMEYAQGLQVIRAIVGPSGPGKSTLASLLLRFHAVDDVR